MQDDILPTGGIAVLLYVCGLWHLNLTPAHSTSARMQPQLALYSACHLLALAGRLLLELVPHAAWGQPQPQSGADACPESPERNAGSTKDQLQAPAGLRRGLLAAFQGVFQQGDAHLNGAETAPAPPPPGKHPAAATHAGTCAGSKHASTEVQA